MGQCAPIVFTSFCVHAFFRTSAASAVLVGALVVFGFAPIASGQQPIPWMAEAYRDQLLPQNEYFPSSGPFNIPTRPFFGSVALNQDSFFGFYPELSAGYKITDQVDFTFYGILWTNPDFSPFGGGSGLWTEVGAGFNLNLREGTLAINPQIGFLNGSLLSGNPRPLAFEGVVPNLTIDHNAVWTEGQFYMGYYAAIQGPSQSDFLHWWSNFGVKPWAESEGWLSIISTGVHFEQLRQTRSPIGPSNDIYLWLGPYLQFALPNNLLLRFNAGWDMEGNLSPNFYKATISYAF